MISIYEEFSAKQHGTELLQDHDNGKEFFFHGMVILLGVSQFFGPIRNRTLLLDDDGSHLVVGSIRVDVKW